MKTIPQLIHDKAKQCPSETGLFYRENGQWVGKSWALYWDEVLRLAQVLTQAGLKKGDAFAIIAPATIQWETVQTAALVCGAMVVGLDPHATDQQLLQMLEHADVKGMYVAYANRFDRLAMTLTSIGVRFILNAEEMDEKVKMAARLDWNTDMVSPDDYATLIYSSGTTGQPKGIRYRHSQILLACDSIGEAVSLRGGKTLCWLPLSNLFQRILNLVAMQMGTAIYFVENPMKIMEAIAEVQPEVLIGVPRFYEKVYQGIQEKLKTLPAFARALLNMQPTRKLILNMVRRKVLGRNMKFMVTGSAPIMIHVQQFFYALGVPLLDAYGTSENVIPMAMNRLNDFRLLTVGKPLKNNDIRISPEGEIEVKGPGVYEGYFKSEAPRGRFTADGYYRTGDFGQFDRDGYLSLKGRRTDLIVTSTGRKISPVDVEAVFRQIPGVENAFVTGNGQKCLVGLLKISTAEVDMAQISSKITAANQLLKSYEQVFKWAVVRDGFSMESGELTLNLKLRRKAIEENRKELIESLYKKIDEDKSVYFETIADTL